MKALVLSGGGAHGAFQAGVLKRLFELDPQPYRVFTGVSVGAINCAWLAQFASLQSAVLNLEQMWLSIDNGDVKKHWLPFSFLSGLWKESLYNNKPLKKLLENNFDPKRVKTAQNILKVGAVSLNSYEYRLFDQDHPEILEAVLASSAFPIMFEPRKIDGHLWTDGGVRTVTPLKAAMLEDVTDIDVIVCSPLHRDEKKKDPKNVLDVAIRSLGAMMDEVTVNDVRMAELYNDLVSAGLKPGKKKYNIRLFQPAEDLPGDSLDFDPKLIKQKIDIGYNSVK